MINEFSMDKKTTRAHQMAENYAKKLNVLAPAESKSKLIRLSDLETREQKEKLKKAREKLLTFIDLLG